MDTLRYCTVLYYTKGSLHINAMGVCPNVAVIHFILNHKFSFQIMSDSVWYACQSVCKIYIVLSYKSIPWLSLIAIGSTSRIRSLSACVLKGANHIEGSTTPSVPTGNVSSMSSPFVSSTTTSPDPCNCSSHCKKEA